MGDRAYDPATLKARGIMEQKQPGLFTVRLRIVGGRVGAADLEALAGMLAGYALDHVHLTTRQGVEIPNVRSEDVESLCAAISAAGLGPATVGPCVRTITACQGALCRHGTIDAQRIAQLIHERFSRRSGLPHKFKIGITGCPNACIKPRENDLGIMGVARKAFHEDLCNACGVCVGQCSSPGALDLHGDTLVRRDELCVGCGKCIAACPTGAWQSTGTGYKVFAGGKMGKRPKSGEELALRISDEGDLLRVVEATIDWYAAHGEDRERFGDTLNRIGIEDLEKFVSSAQA